MSHFNPEQHDLIVCRLIYNNISLKKNNQHKKKTNKNNLEELEEHHNEDENEESEENEDDEDKIFNEDNYDGNKNNKKENEDSNIEKKEIILTEKRMFIFAMKKNIFIVEGNKISENNYKIYKKCAYDYIKKIKQFEKLGVEKEDDKIDIIKQDEMEIKYKEFITDHNIIIKFSNSTNMDKFYAD